MQDSPVVPTVVVQINLWWNTAWINPYREVKSQGNLFRGQSNPAWSPAHCSSHSPRDGQWWPPRKWEQAAPDQTSPKVRLEGTNKGRPQPVPSGTFRKGELHQPNPAGPEPASVWEDVLQGSSSRSSPFLASRGSQTSLSVRLRQLGTRGSWKAAKFQSVGGRPGQFH